MSAEMEIRLARLEGAYEQIDRRLADLRQELQQRFASLEARIDTRIDGLSGRMDGLSGRMDRLEGRMDTLADRFDRKFNWMYGVLVGTWITTMLAVLFRH